MKIDPHDTIPVARIGNSLDHIARPAPYLEKATSLRRVLLGESDNKLASCDEPEMVELDASKNIKGCRIETMKGVCDRRRR